VRKGEDSFRGRHNTLLSSVMIMMPALMTLAMKKKANVYLNLLNVMTRMLVQLKSVILNLEIAYILL